MRSADIGIGFPDINGCMMTTYIESRPPESIILRFCRLSSDFSKMIDIQIFLLDAAMRASDLEIGESLPPMRTYSVKTEIIQDRLLNLLDISFDNGGSISFEFDKAFYRTRAASTGDLPDRMKANLETNDET